MAAPRRQQDLHQSREETDLSSPNFDPLTALYSSDVSIPYPDVQLFNNLAEYESVMKTRTGRQVISANAPASVSSASGATGGPRQTAQSGHGSGDAGYDQGHGPSGVGRESSHLLHSSSETRSSEHQDSFSSHGHLPAAVTGADNRLKSHQEHYTNPYQHHKKTLTASPLSKSSQDEKPRDGDIHMEHSDRDSHSWDSDSSRNRHSYFSASLRDPEYLARKGLREEDYERYKISRRDPKPTSQDLQVETKSESGKRGTEMKITKVARAVGGARGAWSYDTVEKPVEKSVSTEIVKTDDNALPQSFEVERMQTRTSNYRDENRNVLTRMEEYRDAKSGPIHLLYRCMKEKLQARVWTRSAVSVRGICKGYIVAFDKHTNLAMVDVDEYYRNPAMKGVRLKSKKKLAEKTPSGHVEPPLPCEALWLGLRKEKLAQRHMNQVFIRGDNVVSVSIVQDWT